MWVLKMLVTYLAVLAHSRVQWHIHPLECSPGTGNSYVDASDKDSQSITKSTASLLLNTEASHDMT